MTKEEENIIRDIIKAWNTLPLGYYEPSQINSWFAEMVDPIKKAKEYLRRK